MDEIRKIEEELKRLMIEALGFEDLVPEDIDPEKPLFGDTGLGLDSVDALELVMIMDKHYGVLIEDPEEGKRVLSCVRTMAEFIVEKRIS